MTKRKHEVVEVDSTEKKGFEINWNSVMDDEASGGKEHQVPELLIVNAENPPTKPPSSFLSGDQMDSQKNVTDHALDEQLERNKSHLVNLGPSLPDNGEKIRLKIDSLEAEKQRRLLQRSKLDADTSSKLMHATSSGSDAFARGNAATKEASRQGNTDSKEVSRSTFAAVFSKPKPGTQSTVAFFKELEDLGCESVKPKADKKIVTRQKNEWRMLSNVGKAEHSEKQFNPGFKRSKGNQKSKESYGKKKNKGSSTYSLLDDDDEDDSNGHGTPKEWSWEEYPSHSSRCSKNADNTVINVDEEEPQPSTMAEQAVELPEGLQEDICYPSRDDPHFVQVCLKDLECLGPKEFLTSPVMNFYIRFLQQQVSSANRISADCHFFNTYFYKKLSDAVTYKAVVEGY